MLNARIAALTATASLALAHAPVLGPASARAQEAGAQPHAQAQAAEPTALERSPVARMVGEWTGTGVFQMGPGQTETVDVTEKAEWRLGRKAILVSGLGTVTEDDGSERVVHDAVGVIRIDEATGKIMIHAFKADAEPIVSEIEVLEDGRLRWGFEPGPGQRVRFTLEFLEDGKRWTETGEFSPDGGKSWFGFFEMGLDRD